MIGKLHHDVVHHHQINLQSIINKSYHLIITDQQSITNLNTQLRYLITTTAKWICWFIFKYYDVDFQGDSLWERGSVGPHYNDSTGANIWKRLQIRLATIGSCLSVVYKCLYTITFMYTEPNMSTFLIRKVPICCPYPELESFLIKVVVSTRKLVVIKEFQLKYNCNCIT